MDTTLHIKALDLDESALDSLQSLAVDEDARWYYERRRRALVASGVIAAGSWDPLMHPRGRDGRFIDKLGFVRWLVGGTWKRGQVREIASNGDITVRGDDGDPHVFSNFQARKQLYSLPKPKAKLELPDPKQGKTTAGFVKVGGQGGSNPGALYAVNGVPEGRLAYSANVARDTYAFLSQQDDGAPYKLTPMDFDVNESSADVRSQFEQSGFILDRNRNRVYMVKDGVITRLDTGETAAADDVFGEPGSTDRLGAIGQFEMIDRLDAVEAAVFQIQMRTMLDKLPEVGDQFYVKTAKSEDHAKNEVLANWLYEMGGVPVPDVSVGADGVTVASKMVNVDSAETLTLLDGLKDPAIASKIREDMVFDAWLANWDVAGLEYDNIIVVEGVPYRVDAGGALTYRAQGKSKGSMFGPTVGELATLKSSSVNPQATKVFGQVTPAELKAGGERLAAISPTDIRKAVAEAGLDDSMADLLIARRADVLKQVGVDEPSVSLPPPIVIKNSDGLDMNVGPDGTLSYADAFPYPLDLTGKVWHPGTKNFVDGEVKAWWANALGALILDHPNPTTMTVDEMLTRQIDGEPNRVFHDDNQLYDVDVDYVDNDDMYKLTYTNVANGRSFVRVRSGGTYFQVETDPALPQAFRDAYNKELLWTIDTNDRRVESNLYVTAATASDGRLGTTPFGDVAQLKTGDWFLDTSEQRFYRLDEVGPMSVKVSTLDGEEKTLETPFAPLRYRRPTTGSFLSDVLDSSRARNEVSKKKDEEWKSAKYGKMTDGDKKMQAAVAVQPNIDTGAVQQGDVPNVEADPLDGLNESISVAGEPLIVKDMVFDDEAKKLIGKTVYMQLGFEPSKSYSGYTPPRARGIFTVTDVTESSSGGVFITVRDSVGHTRNLGKYGETMEIVEVNAQISPITQFQAKTNNTIVANGEVVGEWKKTYKGYEVKIDAKYSASGQPFRQYVHRKDGIKQVAIPMIVPPGSAQARPKSSKSKDLEKKIREADIKFSEPHQTTATGEAVTLLDGAEIKDGMWVISKTDGQVGQVSGVSTSYLGYVNVKTPDGKVKIRAAKTLSAASDPTGEILPPPSPLYKDVKLSDGTQAFPSQKVLDGSSELVLLEVKPDGSVRVSHPDGKKTWMKASKLAPAQTYEPEKPEDTAVMIAAADQGWKTAPKAKKIPYAAPGGATIPQQSDAVEKYREYAITRKLTRDNFVPQVGMKVRDTKGKQYTIVRIAPTTSSNPSAVWVFDPDTYEVKVKQPSTLWVDHAAELATSDGKPLPKVGGLFFQKNDKSESLPSGTIIYSADTTFYQGGRQVNSKHYYASLPNGQVRKVWSTSASEAVWKNDVADAVSHNWTKIAYVDEGSKNVMTVEGFASTSVVSAVYIHEDEPGVLEKLKADIAAEQIKLGVVEAEKFPGTAKQLIRLPKPTDLTEKHVSTVKPPAASGDGSVLAGPPAVGGALSIDTGIKRLMAQRDSGAPNSKVVYAMGDSDYIEDMAIRMHTAVDKTTGEEMIEVRFGLLEERADFLASRLITNDGEITGDWAVAETKGPQDLVDGDAISVKISGTTGALKPSGELFPNARVVGTPTHIGVSKSGLDAYRVDVAMASGAVGHVIIEKRATPSVKTFEWDPTKTTWSKYFNGSVNGEAASMGWSVRNMNAVGYEANGKIELDENGRKIVDHDNDGLKSIASYSGAARLQYDHPGGGFMSVQVVHPDAEDRKKPVDQNTAIRSNVNGEVVIRVAANDPDALKKISDMMAAAGVPPEKQGQPSADDLTKMALNKVHKQFSTKYEHLDRADVAGSNDDAGVAAVLAEIDHAVGSALGRKATLDDVRLRVMPDGRVTVVLSDDVADAVVKRAGITHAYHSFTGSGYKPEIFSSKASTGLLSTDERWSMGILTSGMSPGADVTNDAGNRVYLRLSTKQNGSIGSSGQTLVSAKAIAKTTDWYWHTGDRYGKRQSNNLAWTSVGGGNSYDNELMMKRKIDPELIGFVTFGSVSARDAAVKELAAQGVDTIGGRPVEDVFIVAGSKTVNDIQGLGVDIGTEIPLTGLVTM